MAAGSDKHTDTAAKVRTLCSQRWNLATLAFFGFLFVYVVRVNLSVAIICMMRPPRLNGSNPILHINSTTANWTTEPSVSLKVVTESGGSEPERGEEMVEMEDEDTCGGDFQQQTVQVYEGEFDWDKVTRSRLLAMYFYGYIFTQIPGGWLAGRYGGRRVWGWCQLISATCTLLTPLAARTHVHLASALRFVLGLAAGVSFPSVHAMIGRWAPRLERSKLVAFAFAGPPLGTILTFSLSALLCAYGFDNGWGSIFYLSGAGNVVWVVLWMYFTADTPSKSTRISTAERDYILSSIGERPYSKEKLATPWRAMFTSGPLWAIISAHLCNNYTNYTLLTSLPLFMKEALKFDIRQNGALSAVPYLCMAISAVIMGQLADWIRAKGYLNTKNTRKVFQSISFLGTAVCISSVGYMTCDQRPVAVLLLCLCLCFMALNRVGYAVNHIDLAPRHAGVLFGITNTAGTIPGMIAPLIAGALTPNRAAEEWRTVFFICAGLLILGAIIFIVLADGELQNWAAPEEEEKHFQYPLPDAILEKEKTTPDDNGKTTLDILSPESNVDKCGVNSDQGSLEVHENGDGKNEVVDGI